MPLLAYNLTVAPLVLAAGSPPPTLPASSAAGQRSAARNVTGELKGLSNADYALIQAQVAANLCSFEWTSLPEYSTATLHVGSADEDIENIDQEIFVDAATGNDANPGTAALPLLTFGAAWDQMEAGRKRRRIFLAAGTYPVAAFTRFQLTPKVGTEGEPVTVLGTPVDSGLGVLVVTATVPSSTGGARRGISAAPHAGDFTGAALLFTSGASAGRRYEIAKDDGTTFTLLNRVNTAVVAGNTFVIELPGSIIDDGGNGFTFEGGDLLLKDVKFNMGGEIGFINGCRVLAAENVEIASAFANVNISDNSVFYPGSFDGFSLSPNPFSSGLRRECGAYIHDANLVVARGGIYGQFGAGGSVIRGCFVAPSYGGDMQFGLVTALINSSVIGEQCRVTLIGRGSAHSIVDGSVFPGPPAIGCLDGNSLVCTETDVDNSGGDAVDVSGGGRAFMRNNLTNTPASNAGVGLNIHFVGSVTVEGDGAANSTCLLNGAGGDVLVGLALKGYVADLNGTRGFCETDGVLGSTLNRFDLIP